MTDQVRDVQFAGQQIRDALYAVRDPQLDRPIIELGFVAGVHIDSGRVHVRLRLPTYFCASELAWLMVADAKAAVHALPWADSVEVCLEDQVGAAQSFGDSSSAFAIDDPDDLWQALRRTAFLTRQHTLLRNLLERGLRRAELCTLTIRDLPPTSEAAVYLQRRAELRLSIDDDAPLVVTELGMPVAPDEIDDHLARIRSVVVSLDGNAGSYRGLLQTRRPHPEEQP